MCDSVSPHDSPPNDSTTHHKAIPVLKRSVSKVRLTEHTNFEALLPELRFNAGSLSLNYFKPSSAFGRTIGETHGCRDAWRSCHPWPAAGHRTPQDDRLGRKWPKGSAGRPPRQRPPGRRKIINPKPSKTH